jgi:hypothetical protein
VGQELKFVSFVRDPKLADVYILSSHSHTGRGGRKFFLQFIGMNEFEGQNFDYEYLAEQSETDDQIRIGFLKLIQTGVLQYYSKARLLSQLEIDLDENGLIKPVELTTNP